MTRERLRQGWSVGQLLNVEEELKRKRMPEAACPSALSLAQTLCPSFGRMLRDTLGLPSPCALHPASGCSWEDGVKTEPAQIKPMESGSSPLSCGWSHLLPVLSWLWLALLGAGVGVGAL